METLEIGNIYIIKLPSGSCRFEHVYSIANNTIFFNYVSNHIKGDSVCFERLFLHTTLNITIYTTTFVEN